MIKQIPTYQSCQASLYRSRAKVLPKLPVSQDGIDLEGEWIETAAGERFLLCDSTDDQGHRILIFATDDNLRTLCNSEFVLGDGTFYSCPGLFSQMYSLHGSVDGVVFPLVFALLPNKTETTYTRFFTLLRDAVLQRNLVLTPETMLMDFETAARNAFRAIFPMPMLRGCFFHYGQCIWRKTQACGLATRYEQEDDIKKLVRRAGVLPLVPVNQVEDVWLNALEENEDQGPEVTRFTDYVTETWVEGLPRREWNHYDNDGPRTTNHAEGWHSKVNKMCQHAHPNIFAAVKLLQSIQATNEAKMLQLSAGGKKRPTKKKYRLLDSRLQQLKDRFQAGQIGVLEYADAASALVKLK